MEIFRGHCFRAVEKVPGKGQPLARTRCVVKRDLFSDLEPCPLLGIAAGKINERTTRVPGIPVERLSTA